ncbi:MAG: leucine-rich repeat protein [Clostridia bacterium]|nr:leucine-rich repeat protein [Clostridia bacterium]
MKNIKVLFLTMILLVAILLLPCSANAAVGEIFINDGVEYKVLTEAGNTGTVQITDYDNNKAQLIIPEIITYDSKQYTVVDIANNAFSGCDTLTNIELPDSITGIGDSAFSNCTSLTSIIIPNSVKAIPYNCFSGSTSLEYVKLPDSLECIRQSSFNDCSFKSLVIPSTVTSIEYNAFGGCSLLEKIIIPNSVTGIEYNAFGGANSLTIYGYTGSYAEEYANNERRTFVTLNNSIYDIINHFTNITSDGVAFVESGTQNYTATLKAGFASTLPSEITIQMGDNILTAGTDYTYNNTTGEVKITKEITGDVKITAQAVNTRKSVNNVLTKVQSNGLDEVYPAEGNYVAMLIPDIDYKLPETITVKVGNTTLDNTQYKYSSKTGELIIYAKNITDDITIEVIAVEIKYKVVFDANGGSFSNEPTDTLTFEDWKATDYDNLEEPTRSGYEFLGYYNEQGTSLDDIMNGEVGIDQDMTFYAKWEKVELKQIKLFEDSKNQEFVIGEDKELIFIIDNDRGNGKVFVDEKELSEENGDYTWEFVEGIYPSIMLSEDYMKILEVGEYTIKFVLDDGRECETIFTVIEQEVENKDNNKNDSQDDIKNNNSNNPETGDNIGIYVAMFIVSVLGICAIILTKDKNNN